jgi:hypothetical protein
MITLHTGGYVMKCRLNSISLFLVLVLLVIVFAFGCSKQSKNNPVIPSGEPIKREGMTFTYGTQTIFGEFANSASDVDLFKSSFLYQVLIF